MKIYHYDLFNVLEDILGTKISSEFKDMVKIRN